MGRDTLDDLIALLKSAQQDWTNVRYCIFDLPDAKGTFKEQMEELQRMPLPPHVKVLVPMLRSIGSHYFPFMRSIEGAVDGRVGLYIGIRRRTDVE